MRRLPITNISPSTTVGTPSSVSVTGNFSSIFHGKIWVDGSNVRSPFYTYDNDITTNTPAPPAGTTLVVATTFEIVENTKYAGKYTVYTKLTDTSPESSEFSSPDTLIRVQESVPVIGSSDISLLSTGFVTNISTYLLVIDSSGPILILENGKDSTHPIELLGRFNTGWGEVMQQNMLLHLQNFSSATAPVNPFRGQLWFDTTTNTLKIMPTAGGNWVIVNASAFSASFRFTQPTDSATWTINHGLGLAAPYVGSIDVFVSTSNGYKIMFPSDVTFVDANNITVSFSNPQQGIAIVRS